MQVGGESYRFGSCDRLNPFGRLRVAVEFYRVGDNDDSMSDESGRTTATGGYLEPVAGLVGLLFALMAGITAPRLLSGDPAEAILPLTFAAGSLATIWVRRRYAAAVGDST